MPKIQMRRDTSANWKSVNPTLLAGEWALETDTKKMKIGDGTTGYNSLSYFREEDNKWQKPSEWIDIRSGQIANSIYFLVGHSAPTENEGTYTVSTYPSFSVYATVSTAANTYDVYVDGIKVATTANGTATTLNWGTLYTNGTITGGHDVTYPSALTTHIVRITPTTGTDTISRIYVYPISGQVQQGVLWVHFNISNSIALSYLLGAGSHGSRTVQNSLAEAITSSNGEIKAKTSIAQMCFYATSLKEIPVLDFGNNSLDCYGSFDTSSLLKKVHIKNGTLGSAYIFYNSPKLTDIILENCYITGNSFDYLFFNCNSLKKLPPMNMASVTVAGNCGYGLSGLENTMMDFTAASGLTILGFRGDSTNRTDGLKAIIVSASAPFDYATAPQINVSYTGLTRAALVNLFNSMPTVTGGQVITVTGVTGAADLTDADLAIATGKGWTVTR